MEDDINTLEFIIQQEQEMMALQKLGILDNEAIKTIFTQIFYKVKKEVERYYEVQEARTMRAGIPTFCEEDDDE